MLPEEIARKIKDLIDNFSLEEANKQTICISGSRETGKSFICNEAEKYVKKVFNNKLEVYHYEFDETSKDIKPKNGLNLYTTDSIYGINVLANYGFSIHNNTKLSEAKRKAIQKIFKG